MDSFDFILLHEAKSREREHIIILHISSIQKVCSFTPKNPEEYGNSMILSEDGCYICHETPEQIFESLQKAYTFDPKRIYDVRLQEENIMDFMRRMTEGIGND